VVNLFKKRCITQKQSFLSYCLTIFTAQIAALMPVAQILELFCPWSLLTGCTHGCPQGGQNERFLLEIGTKNR